MRLALVCGDGFSISRALHSRVGLSPSCPFSFRLLHPGRSTRLLQSLPDLAQWLANPEVASNEGDFSKIRLLTAGLPRLDGSSQSGLTDHMRSVLLDLRHYLALAYSMFQENVDRSSAETWPWRRWLEVHPKDLIGALSWNYDLVLERTLLRNRTPFHWAGAGGWQEWNGRAPPPKGIPVSKPHGSCNFVIDGLQIQTAEEDGAPAEDLGYPRGVHVSTVDAPLTTLSDGKLLTVRQSADIVLPGEANVFSPFLRWMRLSQRSFRHAVSTADTLLVVGFSMSSCDYPEFVDALAWAPRFRKVVVADPRPGQELLDFLNSRADVLEVWRDRPKRL